MISRKIKKWGLILSVTLLVTGCSEGKSVDYSLDENLSKTSTENGYVIEDDTLEQFRSIEKWKEDLGINHWQEKNTYHADADIEIPDGNGMMLMELEEYMNDEAQWKKLCENIFESYERYDGEYPISSAYDKENPVYQYIGTIKDKQYVVGKYKEVLYSEDESESYAYEDVLKFGIKDLAEVAPKQIKNLEHVYVYPDYSEWNEDFPDDGRVSTQNMTFPVFSGRDLTDEEEAAKETAEKFIKKLGFDNPIFRGVAPVEWHEINGKDEEDNMPKYNTIASDDYCLEFAMGTDGDEAIISSDNIYQMETIPLGLNDRWESCGNIKNCYNMPIASVYVNKDGVVFQAEINRPLKVKSITHQVKLLSFDKIKKIICTDLKEQIIKPDSYYINKISLRYVNVADYEEFHKFAIVPAWVLDMTSDTIVINAIDGSVITSQWQKWMDNNTAQE